jgi:CBS domain-containing protein
MVTDRDIIVRGVAQGEDVSKLTAADVMTRGVVWCRDGEDVEDAVRIMESRRVRRLPVINEHERMVGMISIGDVSRAASPGITAEMMKAVSAHHA